MKTKIPNLIFTTVLIVLMFLQLGATHTNIVHAQADTPVAPTSSELAGGDTQPTLTATLTPTLMTDVSAEPVATEEAPAVATPTETETSAEDSSPVVEATPSATDDSAVLPATETAIATLEATPSATPSPAPSEEPQAANEELLLAAPDFSRISGGQSAYENLAAKAQDGGYVRVIVGMNLPFELEGFLPAQAIDAQQAAISRVQGQLLREVDASQVQHAEGFSRIPFMVMEVSPQALAGLMRSPLVSHIEEDIPVPAELNLSVPRIGANNVWAMGYDGSGATVAILDTGVDKNHPFLDGGKVISEACYATNNATYGSSSTCPGGVSSSTAAGSAMPYAGNCPAGECDHGTHVAGIAAGSSTVYGTTTYTGVAPGANIIAIQVFSRFDGYCGSYPCTLSWSSDQIRGLERVLALHYAHPEWNIAAANMSLGGGRYYSQATCDSNNWAIKSAIDNLRSVGIATVISSGNSGYSDSMGAPGCISSAISVGATTDSDTVASYSNSVSFLNLLAPGSSILSSTPYTGWASWSGTSMASPHVTGAWALLKQYKPGATVTEILNVLSTRGTGIYDARNGLTKPRIQVDAALTALGPPAPVLTAPSGAITTKTPTFAWERVSVAAEYGLYIYDTSASTVVYDGQVTALAAGCAVSGPCQYAPPGLTLNYHAYTWKARTVDATAVTGAWSTQNSFNVTLPAPVLSAPTGGGVIASWQPEFHWGEVADAVQYEVQVSNSVGTVVGQQIYSGSAVCAAAVCQATANFELGNGQYTWKMRALNTLTTGLWSSNASFQTPPPPATSPLLKYPDGLVNTTQPEFNWEVVSGAREYHLEVFTPAGNIINQWLAASAVCTGSDCYFTPTAPFADGNYSWKMEARNPSGTGPLSNTVNFTIDREYAVCSQVTEIPLAECMGLKALYESTNGSNWQNNTGWFQTTTPCSWYGITCASNSVSVINLHGNRMLGPLPAELSNLTNLQELRITMSGLSGAIPPELGSLSNLRKLYLYSNNLTGGIPSELGSLSNLEVLFLSLNSNLGGPIPTSLTTLSNLQQLYLEGNHHTGSIPGGLGNLSNLQVLSIGSNNFTGSIPAQLGNLSNLQGLHLYSNELTGSIPPELGNLSNLLVLSVSNNQLSGNIPTELANLANLQELSLNSNAGLSGMLPYELMAGLPALISLWYDTTAVCEPIDPAYQAWLAGLPDWIGTGVICMPQLTQPGATTPLETPTYQWQGVTGAASYDLQVTSAAGTLLLNTSYTAATACDLNNLCSGTPETALGVGTSTVKLRAVNGAVTSGWASSGVTLIAPATPVAVGPTGENTAFKPTYTWNVSTGATQYYLQVLDAAGSSVLGIWYSAATSCDANSCSALPDVMLGAGKPYRARVIANNRAGNSSWSSVVSFTVKALETPVASLPTGPTSANQPTYTWNTIEGADQYLLQVFNAANTLLVNQWVLANATNCPDVNCYATPAVTLNGGNHTWKVAPYNLKSGWGTWSTPLSFVTEPGNTLVTGPSGSTVDTTPDIVWNAATGATSYQVMVNTAAGTSRVNQTVDASTVCAAGVCTFTSPVSLGAGAHTVYVQPKKGEATGARATGSFSVAVPAKATMSAVQTPDGNGKLPFQPTYQWTQVNGATQYYLYVSNASGAALAVWLADATYCSAGTCEAGPGNGADTNLGAGQTYNVMVLASSTAGYTGWSNGLSFTVKSMETPTGASPAGATAANQPTYTWNKIEGADQYMLQVLNAANTAVVNQWVLANATNCPDVNCYATPAVTLNGGNHTWKVASYNLKSGWGTWSTPLSFVTEPGNTLVTGPSGSTVDTTPDIVWNAATGATSYQVMVNTAAGTSRVNQTVDASTVCAAGVCTFTSPVSLGAGAHTVYVLPKKGAAISAWATRSFSVAVPAKATMNAVQTPDGNGKLPFQPTYRWTQVNGATQYYLYVSNAAGSALAVWLADATYCSAGTCEAGPGNGADTNLGAGQTYNVMVLASSTAGYTGWSNGLSFTVKSMETPTGASPAGTTSANQPTYTWNKIEGADQYMLQVLNAANTAVVNQWVLANAANCPDANCYAAPAVTLNGGNYTWKVVPYNLKSGWGTWSSPMGFTMEPGYATITAPSGTTNNQQPDLTWTAAVGATNYQVMLRNSAGTFVVNQVVDASTVCAAGTCSFASPVSLKAGAHTIYVLPKKGAAISAWATGVFTVVPPAKSTMNAVQTPDGNGKLPFMPVYEWTAVDAATQYLLYVYNSAGVAVSKWMDGSTYCSAGTCQAGPGNGVDINLGAGQTYNVMVLAWNSVGYTGWSNVLSFTVKSMETPTGSAPVGATAANQPTYTWNKIEGADQYLLQVLNAANTVVVNQWVLANAANCPDANCYAAPAVTLNGGNYTWKVIPYNLKGGWGTWSTAQGFVVEPGYTTITAPATSTANTQPDVVWNAATGATSYQVMLRNPAGTFVVNQVVDASAVCAAGTCSFTSPVSLGAGAHTAYVLPKKGAAISAWAVKAFSVVPPGKATMSAVQTPDVNGKLPNQPTYQWTQVNGATQYYLYVYNASGVAVSKWMDGVTYCSAGTCQAGPGNGVDENLLSGQTYSVMVLAWSPAGYTGWSNALVFTVN